MVKGNNLDKFQQHFLLIKVKTLLCPLATIQISSPGSIVPQSSYLVRNLSRNKRKQTNQKANKNIEWIKYCEDKVVITYKKLIFNFENILLRTPKNCQCSTLFILDSLHVNMSVYECSFLSC